MTSLLGIFLFFVFIVLTMTIFSGWVAFNVFRLIFGGVARLFGGGRSDTGGLVSNAISSTRCLRTGCRAPNPVTARFCRRCGAQLPSPQRVEVRRAAVW